MKKFIILIISLIFLCTGCTYNEINNLLDRAKKQMKNSEFSYALHDIRIGLEKGVKCVISHLCAEEFQKNTLDDNITYCKYNNLINQKMVNLNNYLKEPNIFLWYNIFEGR